MQDASRQEADRVSGFSADVREIIYMRDRMKCARCGMRTTQIQHRRARGMGGTKRAETNEPANGILLCGSATQGCHGWVETHRAEGLANGWIVPQSQEPSTVPVLYLGDWYMLDNMGVRAYAPMQ